MGKRNEKNNYNLGNQKFKKSIKERDLGVIVDSGGKFSEQCSTAAGMQILS